MESRTLKVVKPVLYVLALTCAWLVVSRTFAVFCVNHDIFTKKVMYTPQNGWQYVPQHANFLSIDMNLEWWFVVYIVGAVVVLVLEALRLELSLRLAEHKFFAASPM